TAASNSYVPGAPDHVWARDSLNDLRPFAVLNRAGVQPAFNLPVYVGTRDEEPGIQQVVAVNYAALSASTTVGASVTPVGPHRHQHEWGGGDEVFIDGLQFRPGTL